MCLYLVPKQQGCYDNRGVVTSDSFTKGNKCSYLLSQVLIVCISATPICCHGTYKGMYCCNMLLQPQNIQLESNFAVFPLNQFCSNLTADG